MEPATALTPEPPIRLDLGCGPRKKDGFLGVDQFAFPGVDHVVQLGRAPLPFDDASVDEVHASHFLEHLTAPERCQLLNELYRVMKPGAKATIIIPHWGSTRAYGDPTHQWPPVSEMFFYYLSRAWRAEQAPHTDKANWPEGYDCDFEATWGYSLNPALSVRNAEYQAFAINNYREAVQDIHATLTRR
jgi:SAM-dependent methyltransferase